MRQAKGACFQKHRNSGSIWGTFLLTMGYLASELKSNCPFSPTCFFSLNVPLFGLPLHNHNLETLQDSHPENIILTAGPFPINGYTTLFLCPLEDHKQPSFWTIQQVSFILSFLVSVVQTT